jgi:hypothetical protein
LRIETHAYSVEEVPFYLTRDLDQTQVDGAATVFENPTNPAFYIISRDVLEDFDKITAGAERDNAKRCPSTTRQIAFNDPIDDFVESTVPADGNDNITPRHNGIAGELGCMISAIGPHEGIRNPCTLECSFEGFLTAAGLAAASPGIQNDSRR